MKKAIITASILSANFARLGQEVSDVLQAGVDQIHFDVMDHHFVPNLTFGAVVCKSLRDFGISAPIDVHLMVDNPEQYIQPFAKAGASLLCFHPETVADVKSTLSKIRDAGMQTGLVFNPEHPIHVDDAILESLNLVLIMSVNPGFGGQSFINGIEHKISETRKKLDQIHSNARLGVDGGIKVENIGKVAHAGADFFVVGSGLFHSKDYKTQVQALRNAIKKDVTHTL